MKTRKIQSPQGEITYLSLHGPGGASAVISTYGATLVALEIPGPDGIRDVVLGYRDPLDYIQDGPNAGKCVGRYANRIARGRFTLDDVEYRLETNLPPSHLHGGKWGLANRNWTVVSADDSHVRLSYISADGEEGFPGRLEVTALYEFSSDEDGRVTLGLTFEATTSRPTVLSLSHHAYFNLSGEPDCLGHVLQLDASRYLPTDSFLVPTGEYAPVDGTPMDFTSPKTIGRDMDADFRPLREGKGYDHCWAVDGEPGTLRRAATLRAGGRFMQVFTTMPGIQLYTGNWLTGSPLDKAGREPHDYQYVALECQAFPDSPNRPEFPSTVLRPGERYLQSIVYKFNS